MENIAKKFTIIDLLGFLLPGAMLVLAYQLCFGNVKVPFEAIFGAESNWLIVYFLGLSYLVGVVMHEAGRVLNCFFFFLDLHTTYWKEERIRHAYQIVFGKEAPAVADKKQCIEAGKLIFYHVQIKCCTDKIQLFSALYSMSRTLVMTLIVVLFMVYSYNYELFVSMLFPVAGIGAVLLSSWGHYLKQSIAYSYTAFLTLAQREDKTGENVKCSSVTIKCCVRDK